MVRSRGNSGLQRLVLDVVKLTWAAAEFVEKERRPVAGASRHRHNDVSIVRNAGSFRRRCGGFCRFWCGAAVPVCQASQSLSCSI